MAKPPNKVLLAGAGALVVLVVLAVGAFTVGPFGGGGIDSPSRSRTTSTPARTRSRACTATHGGPLGGRGHPVGAGVRRLPHSGRRAADRGGQPEVQKLIAYWREQRPIPWERIYKVPDHARFPHMRHVNAEIECQECHGPVETMRDDGTEMTIYQPRCRWAGASTATASARPDRLLRLSLLKLVIQ
jgi:hypothetical protein